MDNTRLINNDVSVKPWSAKVASDNFYRQILAFDYFYPTNICFNDGR
jgi:hypothetical protein